MKDYIRKANTINKIRKMVPSRRRGAEIMREAGLSMKNLFFSLHGDSQVALEVKNPPANAGDVKMQVQALG